MLTTRLIQHTPSRTVLGGHNGAVWVVRALILVLLNFAAVNGDFTPPHAPPSRDYDLTVLPLDELPNVLIWCRQCIEAIRASVNLLAKSSDARKSYTPETAPTPVQHPVAVPACSPTPSPVTSGSAKSNSHQVTGRPSKKCGKNRRTTAPEEDESHSSESNADQDYDILDRNSDDDDDLNPDGYSFDPPGASDYSRAQPSVSLDNDSNTREDRTGRVSMFERSLPRLPDECVKLFKPSE
jgi:hypothetical protein